MEIKNNQITKKIIDPVELGVQFKNPKNLIGKDPEYNANKILEIFSGKNNEFSEAVCLNSAAALMLTDKFIKFDEAYNFSKNHLSSGKAITHLKKIQIK